MRFLIVLLLAAAPLRALAALDIFACTPEWGALARELGGERASVYTATNALQDPHHVEARPSLIARARRADLVVCTGAELEVGWLPLVLTQSGNPKIQLGQRGYFEAASAAKLIEVPQRVDRAMGDVHASGNPHLHLDPRNIARVAKALAQRMSVLDAKDASYYLEREVEFQKRWQAVTLRWEREAEPLAGMPIVVYHKDLSYFIAWLGLREVGTLEPKPGLPPSAAHLAELLAGLKQSPAKAVVRSAYSDPRAADWLAHEARLPAVVVPFTVGGTEGAKDLYGLFEDTIVRLKAAAR
ncbi:MAG: zinc ABC transporter substrate-binding protein [Betaproteobacteria bacterium]|nr:zinc ABC transporter substrate-binding protein [Betaproteobacteria bacterium]MDH5223050.1 zinc ABC transporter substrate-binding protein [Betaproteobacteria bacterium]MDH5350948.1 zinc ABC transporter substrate-binding protein [Betaproteobacteria bacterium]